MDDTPVPELFDLVATHPKIGVHVLDEERRVVYANDVAARMILNLDPEDIVGRRVDDLVSDVLLDEFDRFQALARAHNGPIMYRRIWRGRQLLHRACWVDRGAESDHFVVVTQEAPEKLRDGAAVFESEIVELGPLDALSPREIEVLALLGQGLSVKEIAVMLGRSKSTIDSHRKSIGRKLREADRVHLAQYASAAGLVPADAAKTRVRLDEHRRTE